MHKIYLARASLLSKMSVVVFQFSKLIYQYFRLKIISLKVLFTSYSRVRVMLKSGTRDVKICSQSSKGSDLTTMLEVMMKQQRTWADQLRRFPSYSQDVHGYTAPTYHQNHATPSRLRKNSLKLLPQLNRRTLLV
jgi:hypothetical protein